MMNQQRLTGYYCRGLFFACAEDIGAVLQDDAQWHKPPREVTEVAYLTARRRPIKTVSARVYILRFRSANRPAVFGLHSNACFSTALFCNFSSVGSKDMMQCARYNQITLN